MPLVEIIVPSIPSNVPAFLAKLWKMVENQDTGEGWEGQIWLVGWGGLGCWVGPFMICK